MFGTLKTQYIAEFTDLNAREVLLFSTLLLPMLVLGVSGTFIIDFVCLPVHALLTLNEGVLAMALPVRRTTDHRTGYADCFLE